MIAGVCASLTLAARPAAANAITFAQGTDQYFNGSSGQDWNISTSDVSAGGCNSVTSGACKTVISVSSAGNLFAFNSFFIFDVTTALGSNPTVTPANFSLNATSTTPGNCATTCLPTTDGFTQGGFNGTFTYTAVGGPFAGMVLLTGTFTNATFATTLNSQTGSVGYSGSVAIDPGNLTFSSFFLDFSHQTEEDATWTFSSMQMGSNPFSVGPVVADQAFPTIGTFLATGAGTFATAPGFAPEPGSLSLGLLGGGFLAAAFRYRRRQIGRS